MPTFASASTVFTQWFQNPAWLSNSVRAYIIHYLRQNPNVVPLAGAGPGAPPSNSYWAAYRWLQQNRPQDAIIPGEFIERGLDAQSMGQQLEMDTAMWYGTLTGTTAHGYGAFHRLQGIHAGPQAPAPGASVANLEQMLGRLFWLIQRAGVFRATDADGTRYEPWHGHCGDSLPMASILSHGNRLLVQLPQHTGDQFWDWLWGPLPRTRRLGATHGLKPLSVPRALGNRGHLLFLKELSGKGQASNRNHYGINLPVGGVGNRNPFSGNQIAASGEHGHLYLCYLAPTPNQCGGVLIGVEDSAPIDHWSGEIGARKALWAWAKKGYTPGTQAYNPVLGRLARGWCYGQTGHAHRVGESGKFSATGGKKWIKYRWEGNYGPKAKLTGMVVDLATSREVFDAVVGTLGAAAIINPDQLGQDCRTPALEAVSIR